MKKWIDKLDFIKIKNVGDFPGGPVVKTSPSNSGGVRLIPGQGAKILHASVHASPPKNQNVKNRSNIVTNSIKTFKKCLLYKRQCQENKKISQRLGENICKRHI